jgi:predicted Holliday junction resolvase-like endonuclease
LLLVLLALTVGVIFYLLLRMQAFQARSTQNAFRQLESWRQRELQNARHEQFELARSEMRVQFEQWKGEYERSIRQDAIRKSEVVTLGKVTEHFIPHLPDFVYNPKDARFLGSPIDFLVFDGMTEGEVRSVVFVEIKTGLELRPRFEGTAIERQSSTNLLVDSPGQEEARH